MWAAATVHGEEEADGLFGLSGRDEALEDNGEGEWGGLDTVLAHVGKEGEDNGVAAQAGGNVDGVVEGGRTVGVTAAEEEVEEEESFRAVIPEALEDGVDEGRRPIDRKRCLVKGSDEDVIVSDL